jgi:hypothetical protein
LANLDTLIPDLQKLLSEGVEVPPDIAEKFGKEMSTLITERMKREPREPTLRMSSMGKPDRQLWYEINHPELGEKLHPNTYMKFLIGDVIESVLLTLVELSGHEVKGSQDEMTLAGIKGHRDAVIDGTIVDVKSASPYSFKKFEEHLKPEGDAFGYITQINSYVHASKDDPLVTNKDEGAFLVMQKVTGDITLDKHPKTNVPMEEIFEYKKKMVQQPEPPDKCYEPEPMGKSGNMKLGVNCSYCPFKWKCHEGLRAFHYATGPVFLTDVVNEPKVAEFDKDGNIIEKIVADSE